MLLSGAKGLLNKYGAKIAGSAARGVMRHFGKKKLAKTLGSTIKQMGDKYGWSKVAEFGSAMSASNHKSNPSKPSSLMAKAVAPKPDNSKSTSMKFESKEMRGLP